MRLLVEALAGLCIALVATPVAMAVAARTGIVDHPGPLKPQARPVPYLGGVAVFLAAVPGLALAEPRVLAPLGGALLLGVLDDVVGISPQLRLGGELAVGAGIAATVPTSLPVPFGWLAVVGLTAVLVNGVNMLDGLDSLASGVVLASAVAAGVLLGGPMRQASLALAGGLAGFLVYNRPPARVYLGDGGAYFLGAFLAVIVASSWAASVPTASTVAALLVGAVPAAEVAFSIARRLRDRRSMLAGDRGHPYDLLVARGWGTTRPMVAYVATAAALGAVAVGLGAAHETGASVAVAVAAGVALVALAAACGTFGEVESGQR